MPLGPQKTTPPEDGDWAQALGIVLPIVGLIIFAALLSEFLR